MSCAAVAGEKDARTHVSVLKSKQREAASSLKHVSAAASGSWEEIKTSGRYEDSIIQDLIPAIENTILQGRAQ